MEYQWDRYNEKTYGSEVGKYKFRKQWGFIRQFKLSNKDKILDIAGGSGRFAIPLQQFCNDITVVDINAEAIDLLKKSDKAVKTIHNDFLKTEIEEEYSLILCIEALGYFQNIDLMFHKIKNLLSNDGHFVFTYTNPGSWRFFLRKLKHIKSGNYNYNEIEFNDLKKIIDKSGFKINKVEGMNWIPLTLSSNSRFVIFFEKIETILNLKRWWSQSPWLLISITNK